MILNKAEERDNEDDDYDYGDDDEDVETCLLSDYLKNAAFKHVLQQLEGLSMVGEIDQSDYIQVVAEVAAAFKDLDFDLGDADYDIAKALDYGQVVTDMSEASQGQALVGESLAGVNPKKKRQILKALVKEVIESDMEELATKFVDIQKAWSSNGDGSYVADYEDIDGLMFDHFKEAYFLADEDALMAVDMYKVSIKQLKGA